MATFSNLTDVNIASSLVAATVTLPVANITYGNFAGAASALAGGFYVAQAPSAANWANLCNTVNNMLSILKGLS